MNYVHSNYTLKHDYPQILSSDSFFFFGGGGLFISQSSEVGRLVREGGKRWGGGGHWKAEGGHSSLLWPKLDLTGLVLN